MKSISRLVKRSIVAVAAIIVVSSSTYGQTVQQASEDSSAERPLNMLVLGDSILWGQGLKDEHKAWYQVKTWLQKTAGRDVREKIEAHAGAIVGSAADLRTNSATPVDGEVNRALPSVNDEIDDALKSYADPSRVDLVLVDGCINDVNALNLLNAANPADGISRLTAARCGAPMEQLLGRITSSFPSAHVIVTGYFPIISEKTSNSLLMKFVARQFYKGPDSQQVSGKRLPERLIAISSTWYEVSNKTFAEAVKKANAELAAKGSRQRVLFAEIHFLPEYSFNAPDTGLWGFNASFLRKLLAVISVGKISLRTNDERRKQRIAGCDEFFKRPASENDQQKRDRDLRRMLCHYGSIGHPNRKGALIYSEAIIDQVKSLIGDPGWLRNVPATAPSNKPIR
jgi:hypothetical protein